MGLLSGVGSLFVLQQCHVDICGDFLLRWSTLDPLSFDCSKLIKFMFIMYIVYQVFVEMTVCGS